MKSTTRLLVAMALFIAIHRAAAQVPFTLSASLTNGTFVRSVTTADVNGDGRPDIISVRGNPSFLYVWTNSGNGLFVSNASYSVGNFPYQVIAADVNNDGKPDLITANNSGNSLTVLTNDGNGNFVLASTLPLGSGSAPQSVAAADVNGDGRLDLICANSQNASFTIWTNAGGGIFASNATFITGTAQMNVPQWVTTADVNGDGKPDIIGVCDNSGAFLHLWTNNGTGGFVAAPVPYLPTLLGISCVVAADINGDGKPDLILEASTITSSGILVLTNNGTGGFASSGFYTASSGQYSLGVADVNGDGWPDVMVPNFVASTIIVLTNNGAGILGFNTTISVGSGPEALAAADVNGDGRVDLITGNFNSPGTITVVTNASTFLPKLVLKRVATNLIVSWPAIWTSWNLQQNTNLSGGAWLPYTGPIGNDGTTKTATNTSPVSNRFFRLSNP